MIEIYGEVIANIFAFLLTSLVWFVELLMNINTWIGIAIFVATLTLLFVVIHAVKARR